MTTNPERNDPSRSTNRAPDRSALSADTSPPLEDQFAEIDRLARIYADDFEETEDESGTISLEELSRTYAHAMVRQGDQAEATAAHGKSHATELSTSDEIEIFDPLEEELRAEPPVPISPEAIVEAVLLVGRPDGGPTSSTEIAALMRGVSEAEVDQIIVQLNAAYIADDRAIRIATIGGAYRMQLADDLTKVVDRILGPTREIKLNQAAIDCLALVAYQPGITRENLDKQRGQSSGSILNQLVRRELLEMRREGEQKKNLVPHYYPTARLLNLASLESLEDLPTVEDWDG